MNNNNLKAPSEETNPRWIAAKILTRVDKRDSYLDRLIDSEFRSDNLNEKDKRLLNEIANGVLRNRSKIDWVLKKFYKGDYLKINSIIKNSLRVALYQILFLDKIPSYAVVNEAVNCVKSLVSEKHGKLVNAILRNILRQIDHLDFPTPEDDKVSYLSVFYSHPEWLVERWLKRFGFEETEKLLIANNETRDITIRVNCLKTTREKVEIDLLSRKTKFERSDYLDNYLHVRNIGSLESLDLLKEGQIYVQDVSAGLSVKLLDPQKDERIIDLCAAPGGKLTFISENMDNTGEIIAVDIFEMRLKTLEENCKRLGITNVKTVLHDARNIKIEPANRILIDVPCSGLGTLSKKPDIKWKQSFDHIMKLNQVQFEILTNASKLLLPGGVLVYSTCTIEPEENYNIIQKFLASHDDFVLENAAEFVPKELVDPNGCVQTYPHVHKIDGSFAARLKRLS
jgi:16S rRNA (cytosine967-C5)-methyltransferase